MSLFSQFNSFTAEWENCNASCNVTQKFLQRCTGRPQKPKWKSNECHKGKPTLARGWQIVKQIRESSVERKLPRMAPRFQPNCDTQDFRTLLETLCHQTSFVLQSAQHCLLSSVTRAAFVLAVAVFFSTSPPPITHARYRCLPVDSKFKNKWFSFMLAIFELSRQISIAELWVWFT